MKLVTQQNDTFVFLTYEPSRYVWINCDAAHNVLAEGTNQPEDIAADVINQTIEPPRSVVLITF